MTITNPSFEDAAAGQPVGRANAWTVTCTNTLQSWHGFAGNTGSGELWGVERFESGWGLDGTTQDAPLGFEGLIIDLDPMTFDPDALEFAEDFEEGWGLDLLFELASVDFAQFDVADELFENFENEWGDLFLAWEFTPTEEASFGVGGTDMFDSFESEHTLLAAFTAPDLEDATVNPETFASGWTGFEMSTF